ncbi:MAG: glycosyltransferase family 2 protein, partial [Mycobacteriaceae bacterium]|nr:glycosyltransferase family 2 protein [Mycobacteriaceae bacterium]
MAEDPHGNLPFVSVVTPTYNRRRFLPLAVACYRRQTYPKARMEWVVIDDGEDDVSDFFAELGAREPELNIRFIRRPTRARIGAKRNDLHREARGDIIVAWDDDDYYPPERVAHVVECFAAAPDVQVAGCSTLYIYFSDVKQIYRLGPFTRRHATNGTMAVRRAFALTHFYDETVSVGEEESFLERFSYPMVQLAPLKVMLVMSHNSNTFEKNVLRDNPRALSARTDLTLETFIPDAELCAAFRATSEAAAEAFKALPAAVAPVAASPAVAAPATAAPNVSVGPLAQTYAPSVVAAVRRQLAARAQAGAGLPADVRILQVLEADANSIQRIDANSLTIVISGEAWHQKTRADIVVAPVHTGNAGAVVYFPFLYMSLDERRATPASPDSKNQSWSGRPNLCAFMYSAACEHRNKMFDEMTAALAALAPAAL